MVDNYNTDDLWKMLLLLINAVIVLIIIAFCYLLLEKHIESYLAKPNYTTQQLQEYTLKREAKLMQDRYDNFDLIENGIHIKTGLKNDKNLDLVIAACTSCHSAKLITQNKATRSGWKSMIDWMQETQGLIDLGKDESLILDYLANNYAPAKVSRRPNLDIAAIEWYILNVE